MSFLRDVWDYFFGRGRHVPRRGPAHSSDRHGFWRDLWQLRRKLNINPEHSGSVDIYDHFGCAPWNDNEVKRERRDRWRLLLMILRSSPEDELAEHAEKLLDAFAIADEAKLWREVN